MPPYFVDFEAFQHGEERFHIKELCIIDVDNPLKPVYFLFKADKNWHGLSDCVKQTYNFQTNNLHQLAWNEGETRYCRRCVQYCVETIFPLCRNGIFYVMGTQKLKYLQDQFPKWNFAEYMILMKDLPLLPPNIGCIYRAHGEHCACLKCYQLVKHYLP